MASLTKRERSIAAKYRRIQRAEVRGSAVYSQADSLTLSLARLMKPGQAIRISAEGKGLVLIDQYAEASAKSDEMPKVWAHAAARRWKLKEVTLDE